ncbi:MAG: class I SAM-dependent methyltransferase, partial [Hylemonella sp.]|nr:class I SAM-dependent methyltransferase [Hylemonella sp.]
MTAHTSPDMLAYYAARAPMYDAVYRRPERQDDIAFFQRHIPQRLAGRRVLELACGTGYWTPGIAATALSVLATDANEEPMALARLRPGAENVFFRQADVYALPDDLGHFDAAFAGLWFSHVPIEARADFLRGLHQRLEPGARVLLLDNTTAQCRELPIAETDAQGNTYQHRPLPDGSVHRVLKNFPDEAELRGLLAPVAHELRYIQREHFWLL